MKSIATLIFLAVTTALSAQPPLKSSELETFIDSSKLVALNEIPKLKKHDLSFGTVAPYFGSRMSDTPEGIIVSLTVRDTIKQESGRVTEDRVLIIYKDTSRSPEVKQVTVNLNQGLLGITR